MKTRIGILSLLVIVLVTAMPSPVEAAAIKVKIGEMGGEALHNATIVFTQVSEFTAPDAPVAELNPFSSIQTFVITAREVVPDLSVYVLKEPAAEISNDNNTAVVQARITQVKYKAYVRNYTDTKRRERKPQTFTS